MLSAALEMPKLIISGKISPVMVYISHHPSFEYSDITGNEAKAAIDKWFILIISRDVSLKQIRCHVRIASVLSPIYTSALLNQGTRCM